MRNKNIESLEDVRSRMLAEQTVVRMDARMRIKLGWEARDGLVKALTKVANADGLLFGDQPFRQMPPRWSLDWMVSRATLRWKTFWRSRHSDKPRLEDYEDASAFVEAHFWVRRVGLIGFLIVLAIAVVIGASGFGKPAELGLQIGRDALRRTAASGDIVVIGLDDRSAKTFGRWPWPRKYDAALVDKLRTMGAKRIVYNVIFAEPSDPINDAALAAAFDRAEGKIWLSVMQGNSGNIAMPDSLLPIKMFRSRTRQAHFNAWYGMFGQIEYIPSTVVIDGIRHTSAPELLAGINASTDIIRPDYAFEYKTIPTTSAVDVLNGRVRRSTIEGKTVILSFVSEAKGETIPIFGQGRGPSIYSVVIAAETVKRGVPIEVGYMLPLMLFVAFAIWCMASKSSAKRAIILMGGTAAVVMLVLAGDQMRLHFEMIPALFGFALFGGRQMTRGRIAEAMTTDAVSGLPHFGHFAMIKRHNECAVVAVRVERLDEALEDKTFDEQRALILAIAARINVIVPDAVVHQGEDGHFAFLVSPDSDCKIALLDQQLRALFMLDIVSLRELIDFTIVTAAYDDLSAPFDARLGIALDRLYPPVFSGLRVV